MDPLCFFGVFLILAITDVNCLPEPFSIGGEEGYAHKAMALGARMALKVGELKCLAERMSREAGRTDSERLFLR